MRLNDVHGHVVISGDAVRMALEWKPKPGVIYTPEPKPVDLLARIIDTELAGLRRHLIQDAIAEWAVCSDGARS